jgi:hypothetical protein
MIKIGDNVNTSTLPGKVANFEYFDETGHPYYVSEGTYSGSPSRDRVGVIHRNGKLLYYWFDELEVKK